MLHACTTLKIKLTSDKHEDTDKEELGNIAVLTLRQLLQQALHVLYLLEFSPLAHEG
jgi:hypothetical protein